LADIHISSSTRVSLTLRLPPAYEPEIHTALPSLRSNYELKNDPSFFAILHCVDN
jgi:hypothetical protein